MNQLLSSIVAHPDPLPLRVLQLLNLLVGLQLSVQEYTGHGLQYSKFAQPKRKPFSSKLGMLIIYLPSLFICSTFLLFKLGFLASLLSPFLIHNPTLQLLGGSLNDLQGSDTRLIGFASALTLHFLKRVVEVLFVHRYSGSMEQAVSFTIAGAYASMCASLLYAQQVSVKLQPPSIDLMRYGLPVFIVGIVGNFYHHYLLACLRKPGGKEPKAGEQQQRKYSVPEGGLFSLVVCPHYLFEAIDFLGMAMIGQTTSAFVAALGTFVSLAMRSRSTKLWYWKKIDGFPKDRKAYIPFVY